jgi:protein-L-isoaspartate(D-aspartate) O-methyltransferase
MPWSKGEQMQHLSSLVLVLLILITTACSSGSAPSEFAETAVALNGVQPTAIAPDTATPLASPVASPFEADPFLAERYNMVQTGIVDWGIKNEAVIQAMRDVPRHVFVTDTYQDQAYENHPLPIGYGQTISQPYIVALMTEAAQVSREDNVLEVGTGSGYQAAVLAELVDQVYTIEIVGALAQRAKEDLVASGYENVEVWHADGYFGWQEHAPFDAIVVTAAPDHVPQPLVKQLKIGGRMIIPVGPVGGVQTLWRLTRTSEEEVQTENLGGVRFVPFTREERQE